jgi:hypothetical protein
MSSGAHPASTPAAISISVQWRAFAEASTIPRA